MDLGPFDVAIAHGYKVSIEMFNGGHKDFLLTDPVRRHGAF
jgi:hypothetical protein